MEKYQTMHHILYYLPSHRLHRLGVPAPGWAGRQVQQQTKKRGTRLACPTIKNRRTKMSVFEIAEWVIYSSAADETPVAKMKIRIRARPD
jgi:hypothetical protein